MQEKEVTILNSSGLHARPAVLFVQQANKYKCAVKIEKDGRQVNAKSILLVLSLGISKNSKIKIITEGENEKELLDSLINLIENKFGEE